ncbi:MAG: PD-(D/E)XK nuclease family protein, partial [Pseudomonadota bacterium]|nr:PD-(D/E)XK nuclease family protein [Pseudomonadota bacterium]
MQQEELFAALEEGVTVVTANQRLARRLAICYASVQQARGLQVWETPDVLPWPAWIARVWTSWFDSVQKADPVPPALLAPEQEQVLWEISIRECERDNPLFDVHSAAMLAREAWDLWHAWRLQLTSHEGTYTQDTRTFLKWAAAFESRCKTGQFIDSARVADALADRFTSGRLCTPARLVLAGFDEFTPQQRVLFEVLRELGCEVTVADTTKTRARRVVKLGVPDAEREVRLAACWARARLEQNPKARIGIIVPDLDQVRMRIERIFEDILQPGSVLPDGACDNTAYHISLGLPLAKYPVIHTALIVLDLSRGPLALTQVGNLLRSPFTKSGDSELSRRALLDARLRELGVSRISWRKLAQLSRERDKQGALRRYACPVLAEMLSAFGRIAQALPDRQSPGAWTRSFGELLHAVGWPGERTLSSEEFQAVEAWGRVLQSLAGIECIVGKIGLAVGLSRLRQVAQTVFQPESPDAPVQVLGILETSGERFDYLWLMGMHDESWPRAAGPNPLLPIALQRTH